MLQDCIASSTNFLVMADREYIQSLNDGSDDLSELLLTLLVMCLVLPNGPI